MLRLENALVASVNANGFKNVEIVSDALSSDEGQGVLYPDEKITVEIP